MLQLNKIISSHWFYLILLLRFPMYIYIVNRDYVMKLKDVNKKSKSAYRNINISIIDEIILGIYYFNLFFKKHIRPNANNFMYYYATPLYLFTYFTSPNTDELSHHIACWIPFYIGKYLEIKGKYTPNKIQFGFLSIYFLSGGLIHYIKNYRYKLKKKEEETGIKNNRHLVTNISVIIFAISRLVLTPFIFKRFYNKINKRDFYTSLYLLSPIYLWTVYTVSRVLFQIN